jgi:hypothetical protein
MILMGISLFPLWTHVKDHLQKFLALCGIHRTRAAIFLQQGCAHIDAQQSTIVKDKAVYEFLSCPRLHIWSKKKLPNP